MTSNQDSVFPYVHYKSSSSMPRKLIHDPQRGTHPLVWLTAIICTIVSVAVIIAGVVVFAGYMVIHPRVPFVKVTQAHLDKFQNDPTSLLETAITIVVRAENNNAKAHASFSGLSFTLSFQGLKIARLKADPFDLRKNHSVDFNYVVEASSVPLNDEQVDQVDGSIKRDRISFDLEGDVGARWRIGLLGSVRFKGHLNCRLNFHALNGSYIYSPCSSRAKYFV